MNKDQVKGRVEETKGNIKEFAGDLGNDKELELRGSIQKNTGKAQSNYGDAKEDMKEAWNDTKESAERACSDNKEKTNNARNNSKEDRNSALH